MYKLVIIILIIGFYSCQQYEEKEIGANQSKEIVKSNREANSNLDFELQEIFEKYKPSFFLDSVNNFYDNIYTIEIQNKIINDTVVASNCIITDVFAIQNKIYMTLRFGDFLNFNIQVEIDKYQLDKVMKSKTESKDLYQTASIIFLVKSIEKINSIYQTEDENGLLDVKFDDMFDYIITGNLLETYIVEN